MTGGSDPDAAGAGDDGRDSPLPPLSAVIARHGLQPRRALGQHFLLDPSLCGRISRAAQPATPAVILEVGPGPGGLTRALLATGAARIVAIEKDRRCVAALAELQARYPDRLEIVEGDALSFDIATLGPARIGIVANLPYNVGTRLLLRWLERVERIESMTLMFQREVAARITATGGKDYGGLSVRAQWLCTCERLFDVSPRAFVPPPGVVSIGGSPGAPRNTARAGGPRRPRRRYPSGIRPAQEDAAPRPSHPYPGPAGAASERRHRARSAGRDALGCRFLRTRPCLGGTAQGLTAARNPG